MRVNWTFLAESWHEILGTYIICITLYQILLVFQSYFQEYRCQLYLKVLPFIVWWFGCLLKIGNLFDLFKHDVSDTYRMFFFFFVLFYQSNLVSIVWIFYIISRLSDDTSCDCWCFFYRFYITLLGLNHLQPSRFNCKVANLIMQIGCFQILLLLGMEFLRTWVMWRNWYVYDHYLIGITFISSTSYFFNQL